MSNSLTNSDLYLNKPKSANCISRNFAWNERTETEDNNPKEWPTDYDPKGRRNLTFAKGYAVEWHPKSHGKRDSVVFHNCIIEIDARTARAAN